LETQKRPQNTATVIPDGIFWRKYLKLLSTLIEESSFSWILLESAAEVMDWRNSSPSIQTKNGEYVAESAALQERNKIRQLFQDCHENVWPLCDLSIREEECDEWDLLDYPGMSVTDRSRHALLRAGRWLSPSQEVFLLSNDDASFDQGDLRVFSMDDFLILFGERYPEADMDQLLTLKRACEENYQRRNTPPKTDNKKITEEHVEEGLKNKALFRGRLEVTKANPKEAYVTVGNIRYFCNLNVSDMPRALHQDVVIVQPLPESEWGRPVGRRRLVHYRTDEEDTPEKEEGLAVPSIRIVSVSSTSRRPYVATLVDEPEGDERAVLVVPMDTRIPKIRIQSRGWPAYGNQRLLVEVDGWEQNSNYPSGHCIKVLGPVGDMETEVRTIHVARAT
jgi:exoribonuclease R